MINDFIDHIKKVKKLGILPEVMSFDRSNFFKKKEQDPYLSMTLGHFQNSYDQVSKPEFVR